MVGILWWTQRLRVIFVFVNPPVSALFSFSLFFSFGLACAEVPAIRRIVWLLY
jgi:hypothetical protein